MPAGPASADALLTRVGLVAAALERATDRSDVEHVHKLRTSLRRLRAVMRAYAPVFPPSAWRALREEVAELFRATSPLRDLDVQTERLSQLEEDAPRVALPGIDAALEDYAHVMKAAESDVEGAVDVFARRDTLRAVGEWAVWAKGGPVPLDFRLDPGGLDGSTRRREACPLARRRLTKTSRGVRKGLVAATERVPAAGAELSALASPDLHSLRIAAKKLRYTCEVFVPVLPRANLRKRAKELGLLQDHLGDLRDADVGEARLLGVLDDLSPGDSLAPGYAYLLGDTRAGRIAAAAELDGAWTAAGLDGWLRELEADLKA